MKIESKVVVVSGASEGIGRELVSQLAQKGAQVIALSRQATKKPFGLENVKEYDCDVRMYPVVREVCKQIEQDFGGVDILINNAGIWHKTGQLETISYDVIADVVATNMVGTINLTKEALPMLRNAKEAAIVNIISKSGVVAQEGQSIYTATKYAVRGFTDVLRVDLKETNIHILAVYQSGTNTEMFKKSGEDFSTENFTEPADLANAIISAISGPRKFWVKELHVDRS